MALCCSLLGNTLVDLVLLHTDIAITVDEALMAAVRIILVEVNLLDIPHSRKYLRLLVNGFKSSIVQLDEVGWAIRLEIHLDSGQLCAGRVRRNQLYTVLTAEELSVADQVVLLRFEGDIISEIAL